MNIEDAAHRLGHECDGGLEALAVRMGVGYKVLNGKLNPNDRGHVLGLVESVRMQQLTGRADVLFSMAEALGYVCIKRPDVTSGDVAHAISHTCAEFGDFLRQIDATMSDGRVTRNEMRKVEKELAEMIGAATSLLALVGGRSK